MPKRRDQAAPIRLLVLGVSIAWGGDFFADTAVAQAVTIGHPELAYTMFTARSDGEGGEIMNGNKRILLDFGQENFGNPLTQATKIPPLPPFETEQEHLEVFSNAAGTSFWSSAISPTAGTPPVAAENIGGQAIVFVDQAYRKDSADAFLRFEITKMQLFAFGPENHPMENEGVTGVVAFILDVFSGDDSTRSRGFFPFQTYEALTKLSGRPLQYEYETEETISMGGPLIAGPGLDIVVSAGGEGETFIKLSLNSPTIIEVDLSDIDVGGTFTTEYFINAQVVDTIQFDTTIQAFGRDPLDPGSGIGIVFDGLTPIGVPVPEPGTGGTLALLLPMVLGGVRHRKQRCHSLTEG